MLPTISHGNVWTHKVVLQQDIPNGFIDFVSPGFYQDFVLLGLPANHIILGVKVAVLSNFDLGEGNTAMIYVGNSAVFPVPGDLITGPFVTSISSLYGIGNLTVPSGGDPTYAYGSSRWFTLSTPGSNSTISQANCVPQRFDDHDVIARVVVQGSGFVPPAIDLIAQGLVEIAVQYTAI